MYIILVLVLLLVLGIEHGDDEHDVVVRAGSGRAARQIKYRSAILK
jgi:hypothetical protein